MIIEPVKQSEFVPQIPIPEDDEELLELLEKLGY